MGFFRIDISGVSVPAGADVLDMLEGLPFGAGCCGALWGGEGYTLKQARGAGLWSHDHRELWEEHLHSGFSAWESGLCDLLRAEILLALRFCDVSADFPLVCIRYSLAGVRL